jgi:hypothetical protein
VNALSHGTLFDDQAPYDSQAWLLPVVLAPDQVADALPQSLFARTSPSPAATPVRGGRLEDQQAP